MAPGPGVSGIGALLHVAGAGPRAADTRNGDALVYARTRAQCRPDVMSARRAQCLIGLCCALWVVFHEQHVRFT
jgi:hypothetical protein